MKISGANHLFFRPRDLGRSLRFYRDALGLPCELHGPADRPEAVSVRLGGGFALVLGDTTRGAATFESPAPPFALSLQVEDPDVFAKEISARDVQITKPPHDTYWGTRMFSAKDPDGIELHFERPVEYKR